MIEPMDSQDLAGALAEIVFKHHAHKITEVMNDMKKELEEQLGNSGWEGQEMGRETRQAAQEEVRKLVFHMTGADRQRET